MRILIGTDLSGTADEAVRQGFALAAGGGHELALCHVLPEPQIRALFPEEHERDLGALLELQPRVAQALEAQVERLLGGSAAPFEVFIEQGSDYAELIRRAEQWHADLLVVGSHGRSGIGRFFSRSVAEHVVRYAPSGVLVARERPKGIVLVATDLSDPSQPALAAGAREAARRQTQLVVVHVTEALAAGMQPAMALLGMNPVSDTPEVSRERALLTRQIIEGALQRFGASGEIRIVEGDPETEILALVDSLSAELLVVATRGRTSVARVLLGSVAANLVENAPCSVLAVHLTPS